MRALYRPLTVAGCLLATAAAYGQAPGTSRGAGTAIPTSAPPDSEVDGERLGYRASLYPTGFPASQ